MRRSTGAVISQTENGKFQRLKKINRQKVMVKTNDVASAVEAFCAKVPKNLKRAIPSGGSQVSV